MIIYFIHHLLMSFKGFLIWKSYQKKVGSNLNLILIPEYDERLLLDGVDAINLDCSDEINVIMFCDSQLQQKLGTFRGEKVKCKKAVINCLISYYLYNPEVRIAIISMDYPKGRNGNYLLGLNGLSSDQLIEAMVKGLN